MHAVARKPNEQGHNKYKYRKGASDHQLAGEGVGPGDQADQVATENEEKQGSNKRKKFSFLLADEIIHQAPQKQQSNFSYALAFGGHQAEARFSNQQEQAEWHSQTGPHDEDAFVER